MSKDIIIDETISDSEDGSVDGVVIDTTDESGSVNRVDLSNLVATKKKAKTVINHELDISKIPGAVKMNTGEPDKGIPEVPKAKPKKKIIPQPESPSTRTAVAIDAIAAKEENPDAHISPLMDIVDTNDPNSIFMQYVKDKDAEAREWIAERQDKIALEQAEKSEEDGIEIDTTTSDESTIGSDKIAYYHSAANVQLKMDDDLDISGLMDEEKENEVKEDMSDEVKTNVETPIVEEEEVKEEIEIDAGIDKEELPYAEEVEEKVEAPVAEEAKEEEEDEGTPGQAIGKIEGVTDTEKEEYDAKDIDLTADIASTFEMEDIEEEETDPSTNVAPVDNQEVLKNLQKLATEKLKPVSQRLDISSFTVLKKPVKNINPIFEESSARVVKWVLPAQESTVLMKEFSGAEIEKLREYSENGRSIDSLNRRYNMIYEHIVSPKPATFEQWLKSTPFEDVDHYFFSIYMASFKGANYLPMDCPNKECGETFITDDINIMDMVKFDTKEAKAKFTELYQSETTPAGKGIYCSEIVPISDKVAIGFRQPSIYNIFEIASLDDKTRSNYSTFLEYVPFIDELYMIDAVNGAIAPIGYTTYADNAQKNTRSKILKFDQVFSSLSVDEFGIIKAYVRAIGEKTTGLRYVYPAVECPKCHKETNEIQASGEELVFTRYQLGALVTTSLS